MEGKTKTSLSEFACDFLSSSVLVRKQICHHLQLCQNLSLYLRIGPFEVESVLMEHPAVAESAVVSSPDPIRGEVVKAFIVLNADYKSHDQERLKKEIQEHVKRTTAPYKYPRKVEFIQELPKTVSGKIKRNELRKKEWETI
ncbi:Acyl-coenzyme A synthetase ACSM3, mitochondrial [Manis javanica]|nr:Acyl-coenzyme A synthetase ACSM3, mitochondrial [Manis javanica]